MKRVVSVAFVAFGIATLCLLALLGPLIAPAHTIIYHASDSALPFFEAVLFDLFAFSGLLTALLLFAERPGRRQFVIWCAILSSLPLIVLKNAVMLASLQPLPHWLLRLIAGLLFVSFIALSLCWKPSFIPGFQRALGFLRVVFGFVALNGIFMVGQLLWYGWQARALNPPAALHQRAANSTSHASGPRVIWIVLDELSYQQVYEQRFPGLSLPTFDEVAQQSTLFTHVVPAGIFTEAVIPSLMSGLPVDDIRSSSDGRRLSLHDPVDKKWLPFDPHQTVFQDALNAGYSTAIAGWYNPYCRILPQVLDHCYWTSHLLYPGGIDSEKSVADNVSQQMIHGFRALSSTLPHHYAGPTQREQALHIADYRDLRNAGDALLSDPSANFILLHMPIPHPLGIYDRHRKVLTTRGTSYIDNLALTDIYLAHVRDLLRSQNQWDSSTIVIMGDHSWRTSLVWSKIYGWTPEDQAASHGALIDDRPAYIVKLPSQQQGARIDASFPAVRTRALLDALMKGQLRTPDELKAWVHLQK